METGPSQFSVTDGAMSILEEDCQYRGNQITRADSRELALVAAHDYAKSLPILEYGVIELNQPPKEPCGRCYVCINERGIVAEDIERCDLCKKPFASSDWRVSTGKGTFHNACEPRDI